MTDPVELDELRFDDRGLIPAVVQDADSSDVLMMAWMNRESLERTLDEGRTVFWSRSRRSCGARATRPVTFNVEEVRADCDGDVLRPRPPGRRRVSHG